MMPELTQVLFAPRLGKEGELRIGCCGILFNEIARQSFPHPNGLITALVSPGGKAESAKRFRNLRTRIF